MDKYEYKVRAEEIKVLISSGKYGEAVKIADTIDWRRVKSTTMLCTISDLYKVNRRFEESKEILLLAYERYPSSRAIVYSLCELSIKMGEFVQAVEYYKEFVRIAPRDTGRYILQYRLYEAQDVSLEERIAVLEEFKKHDYREKWAYELAYLYHRVGLTTECIEEVDEMFLWFGVGKFVMKALELKALHEPLSQEQQARYQAYKSGLDGSIDREAILKKDEDPIGTDVSDTSPNMMGRQSLSGNQEGAYTQSGQSVYTQPQPGIYTPPQQPLRQPSMGQTKASAYGQPQTGMYTQQQYSSYEQPQMGAYSQSPSYMYGSDMPAEYAQMQEKQPTKPFYNTPEERDAVEKAALEAGMPTKEQLQAYYNEQAGATGQYQNQGYYPSNADTGSYAALDEYQSTYQSGYQNTYAGYDDQLQLQNTGRVNAYQRAPHVSEPIPVNTARRVDDSIPSAPPKPVGYDTVNLQKAIAESMEQIMAEEEQSKAKATVQEVFYEDATKEFATPDTASWTRTDAPLNQKEEPGVTIRPTRKVATSHYDDILKQDYDGQISMVVPENDKVEDQITGQISIDDIMNRIKQQQRERQEKEVAKIVQDKISTVISQYDEDVKYDLQKEMEKEVKRELMGGNRPKPEKNAGRALLSHAGNVVRPSTAPFVKAGEEGIRRANEEKLMDDDDIMDLDNLPDDIPDIESDADTNSETDPNAESDADLENEKTDSDLVSVADDTKPDEQSDTESDIDSDTESDTDSRKESDSDKDTDSEKESDKDSDKDLDKDSDTESDSDKDIEEVDHAKDQDASIKSEESADSEDTDESKDSDISADLEESKEGADITEEADLTDEIKEIVPDIDADNDSEESADKDTYTDSSKNNDSDIESSLELAKESDTDEDIEEDNDQHIESDSDFDNDSDDESTNLQDDSKDKVGTRRGRITVVEKDESSALEVPEYTEEVVEMSLGDTFGYEDSDNIDEAEDAKESGNETPSEESFDEKSSDDEEPDDGDTSDAVAAESGDNEEDKEVIQEDKEDKEDKEDEDKLKSHDVEESDNNSHRAGFSEGEAETESEAKELDTRVRVMTPEEKELFGPYIHHRKSRKQIIRAIDSLNMSPATNNAIVTGEEGTGTINLAKGLIKSVQAGDSGFSGKVAKITAQALNRKSVSQVIEKLDSGALIIQRAADMKTDTVDSLYKELTADKHGIIIVMEDNHKDMDRLLKRHPELSKCFNVRVDVEALDNESLVAYAKQYALEREYKIDNFGMLSLHSRIEEMQTIDHDVTISEVRDIVDEAIRSAEKKTISHFFDVVLNKRYDEEDMIILTEKDFERADHK
ncbi:hypothetical protein [Butyrivibrio fibrisolvens]|uniref:Uncharacterized protein n=1 Tax=Butyrivibrio fibrisolvens TaxID=831 RepID=A0A317G2T4_BUTFI|nr:hypothetical protein [Butyrivibrio fibrisolvens]PWT26692.1 hypothetical protein CPT75_05920 [Butyrivibrio fibrisolvens]